MSQLIFSSIPGFFDLADSSIAGGQPLTDDSIGKISHNAKFGIVRCEIVYMGFYADGNTVATPFSPVDGYAYSRAEIVLLPQLFSTQKPAAGFVPGQAARPALAVPSGAGTVLTFQIDVNDATGLVACLTAYFSAVQTNTNDGCVKVYAVCQRSSVNVAN